MVGEALYDLPTADAHKSEQITSPDKKDSSAQIRESQKRVIELLGSGRSLSEIQHNLAEGIQESASPEAHLESDMAFVNRAIVRKEVLAKLSESDPTSLAQWKDELEEQYRSMEESFEEEPSDALARRRYHEDVLRLKVQREMLAQTVADSAKIDSLRKEDRAFWDEVLKATGGIGASKEVLAPSIGRAPETKKVDPLLDELRRLQAERNGVQQRLEALSPWPWNDRVAKKATAERLASLTQKVKTLTAQLKERDVERRVPQLPDSAVEPIENAKQLYQAEREALASLRETRNKLGFFAFSEKSRLDKEIQKKELLVTRLSVQAQKES